MNLFRQVFLCMLLIGILCGVSQFAEAADTQPWEKEWNDMRSQMKKDASDILTKEIDLDNTDVSEDEQATTLKSYDIDNAMPVWTLDCDVTMLADYHGNQENLSKLLQWDDWWYIPATTMLDNYATIRVKKLDDGYEVCNVYFGDDAVYAAETAEEIKHNLQKLFRGEEIEQVRNISLPFYRLNLLYIKQSNGKEKVIPYQGFGAATLQDIQEESGKVYSLSRFISDMESTYDEYTKQEVAEIIEQNKKEKLLGGSLQPRKKAVKDVEQVQTGTVPEKYNRRNMAVAFVGLAVLLSAGIVFAVSAKKKGEKNA